MVTNGMLLCSGNSEEIRLRLARGARPILAVSEAKVAEYHDTGRYFEHTQVGTELRDSLYYQISRNVVASMMLDIAFWKHTPLVHWEIQSSSIETSSSISLPETQLKLV